MGPNFNHRPNNLVTWIDLRYSFFIPLDHVHIDSGHTHSDGGHSHGYVDRYTSYDSCSGNVGPAHADYKNDRFDCPHNYQTDASNIGILASTSGLKGADSSSR